MTIRIEPLSIDALSGADLAAWNAYENRLRQEAWPGEPLIGLDETIRQANATPPFVEMHVWAARRRSRSPILGMARLVIRHAADNQHAAYFHLGVLPEQRRQGLGTHLLRHVVEAAREAERPLLVTATDADVPAGEAFMTRVGGCVGQVSEISQLHLKELDGELIGQWKADGEAAGLFQLGWWDGPFAAELLPEIAILKQAMNLAPRDDLGLEDSVWTPGMLRQIDDALEEKGIERWVVYGRSRDSGELAGYTELFWRPDRPDALEQGDTAVRVEHRRRGLGRWLKAAMLHRVLVERPQVEWVRTAGARSNTSMRRINDQLGFCSFKTWRLWNAALEQLSRYLETVR
jgi:GNAT superfamily N-acetyltransferase